jgi:hypothetical protein
MIAQYRASGLITALVQEHDRYRALEAIMLRDKLASRRRASAPSRRAMCSTGISSKRY